MNFKINKAKLIKLKKSVKLISLTLILSCLSAQGKAALLPSQVVDLSLWTLTLPVNSSGDSSGTAATISTADLESGYTSSYFYTSINKKVAFYAPSNGATTSPGSGSDHTRCELREMYNGIESVGNHEWLSSTGGTLRGSAAIGSVSVNSSAVIFSQIHGIGGDAFVLLLYRPSKSQIEVKIYDSPGAKTSQSIVVATKISLGNRIDYLLAFSGRKVTVAVNGITKSVTVNSAWQSEPVHFAAGAYHAAPSSGNPSGDASKVYFYSLSVSHP